MFNISRRKEKKLYARGNRIRRVAIKYNEGRGRGKINRTSLRLAEVYVNGDIAYIDSQLLQSAL